MPTPKGTPAKVTVYVDADHATDLVTRRSTSGMIMFVNSTPIRWISKRQNTVETSTHGAELTAGKLATEAIIEMRYKLRMLGVPIDGPAVMLCDNNSVVLNVSLPSSVLKKKHNAVAYHRIREAVAAHIMLVWYIRTFLNLADICTKILGNTKHHQFSYPLVFRSSPKCKMQAKPNERSPKTDIKRNNRTNIAPAPQPTTGENDHRQDQSGQSPSAGRDNGDRPEGKTSRKTSTHQEVLPETYQSGYQDNGRSDRKGGYHVATRGTRTHDMVSRRHILDGECHQQYGIHHKERGQGLADRGEHFDGRHRPQRFHHDTVGATDKRYTVAERHDDPEPPRGDNTSPPPNGARIRRDGVSQHTNGNSHLRQGVATEGVATARVGMRKGSVKGQTDRRPKHVSRPVTKAPAKGKRERTDEPTDNDSYSF